MCSYVFQGKTDFKLNYTYLSEKYEIYWNFNRKAFKTFDVIIREDGPSISEVFVLETKMIPRPFKNNL